MKDTKNSSFIIIICLNSLSSSLHSAQYKPLWWFLNAAKLNWSFETRHKFANMDNNGVSWRLVVCVSEFKGQNIIFIVRMCV